MRRLEPQATIGIGIITYNRRAGLEICLAHIRQLTDTPYTLVVADDGSDDGTPDLCARERVVCVTGKQMGAAWNKNRALFYLHRIVDCDVVILIEDDTYPNLPGWQRSWARAAQQWGHVNFAGPWFRDDRWTGAGDVSSPIISPRVSAQCAAFSREALNVCGFVDTRFTTCDYEHAEHSGRLVRAGFGGEMRLSERGEADPYYYLLSADLTVAFREEPRDEAVLAASWTKWEKMFGDPPYRDAWRTKAEFAQFRREMTMALRRCDFSPVRRISLAAQWIAWRRRAKQRLARSRHPSQHR
jgi:glycosyltransferase involved in cell wall biosynthesis